MLSFIAPLSAFRKLKFCAWSTGDPADFHWIGVPVDLTLLDSLRTLPFLHTINIAYEGVQLK